MGSDLVENSMTRRVDRFMKHPMTGGRPAKILLIEDNPDHAELILRGFEDHPVSNSIFHLADGEAALDYLLRRGSFSDPDSSPRPQLVLLDLRLPKVDGLEVLRQIRAERGLDDLPVVVLTTSKADKDILRAYENQANSFLVKPLDFASFTSLINDLGYYWLSWNHFPGRRLGATG